MLRYKSRRPDQAGLKMRIKELAATRVRYRYRRIHVLLRREGWQVNAKRIHRLYRELDLQLRSKTPKRRFKAKLREDRTPALAVNDCWSMDFLSDQLFDGRKIRVLTIVANFTRLSPAIDVRLSYRGADVVQTLERVAQMYGCPKRVRVDQGWPDNDFELAVHVSATACPHLRAPVAPRLRSAELTGPNRSGKLGHRRHHARQCLCRVVQWPRPRRVSECILVLELGRRTGKM